MTLGKSIALVGLLLTMSGCTSMTWHKPEMTSAQVHAALDNCITLARATAWREQVRADRPPHFNESADLRSDDAFGDRRSWVGQPRSAVLGREQRNACMESQGYRLEPTELTSQ